MFKTDEEFTTEDLYRFIIQIENLYENEEISYRQLNTGIYNGFKKLQNYSVPLTNGITNEIFPSKVGYITKQVVQGIGRLNRTFNKRSNIRIYISKTVFMNFDTEIVNKEIVSPEIEMLAEYIDEKRDELTYTNNNYQAEHISYASKNYIYELMSNTWSEEKILYWKRLREVVLKYPTVDAKKYKKDRIFLEYYIHNEDNSKYNKYYFHEFNDFSQINILFDENKDDAILRLKKNVEVNEVSVKECSCENSRLDEILRYPGMIDYFEENGYATSFKQNEYMLSPVLYQNIYKGALGEVAGKFILENELKTQLFELNDENFELFDYMLTKGVYVDFKHWRINSFVDKDTYLKKVYEKLKAVGGSKAYIINLLDEGQGRHKITETYDGMIVEIPYLIDSNTNYVNVEAIEMIRKDFYEYKDND